MPTDMPGTSTAHEGRGPDRTSGVHEALTEIGNLKERLQSLIAIEQEIVESETWNFDASILLSILADRLGKIPFDIPDNLYDLKPTGEDDPSEQNKDKEKSSGEGIPRSTLKRAVFHLDPEKFQDTWWASSLRTALEGPKKGK